MKLKALLFALAGLIFLQSCFNRNDKLRKIDNYYISDGDWDYARIPLIKPFELLKVKGGSTWGLNAHELPDENLSIAPVGLFNVDREVIYGHQESYEDPEWEEFKIPEKWFILDTKNQKLLTYDSETEFLEALQERNLNEKLLNPDIMLEEFREKIVLKWFPDSVKTKLNTVKN